MYCSGSAYAFSVALFALELSFVCVFSQVLIVVPFIGVTVVTLATFIHNSTMGMFVFYQVTFVSEVLFTERFLAFVFPCFAIANHVMV